MEKIIDEILSKSKLYNTNIEYINFLKSIESDNILIEKYFANIDGVRFDISTPKYNYRIYVDYIDCGKYLLEIRKNLSCIYKSYGVHWEIYSSVGNNHIVTIEEREKLEICDEEDISCDELLLCFKKTLDDLSERLNLQDIFEQIKTNISSYKRVEVNKLVLIKEGLVNASDYAYSLNNEVILLEDFDFAFCLTNYRGNLISFKGLFVDVNTTCGVMTFSLKFGEVFYLKYNHIYDQQYYFFLYDNPCNDGYLNNNVYFFDDTIQSQINVFTKNNEIKSIKYEEDYLLDYFDKFKLERKKNSLLGDSKVLKFDRKNEKRIF